MPWQKAAEQVGLVRVTSNVAVNHIGKNKTKPKIKTPHTNRNCLFAGGHWQAGRKKKLPASTTEWKHISFYVQTKIYLCYIRPSWKKTDMAKQWHIEYKSQTVTTQLAQLLWDSHFREQVLSLHFKQLCSCFQLPAHFPSLNLQSRQ